MLITPERAYAIVLKQVHPLKAVSVSLAYATGCCLAEDVRADRDLPPVDNSAMDGFAVRYIDLKNFPVTLPLVGEMAAGQKESFKFKAGTCASIMTGASVPAGADTVVQIEHTRPQDDSVTFLKSPAKGKGANIRLRGHIAAKRQIVLHKGTVLDGPQIGACAAMGVDPTRVYGRPKIAIVNTGRELFSGKGQIKNHQIRDSNGPTLASALKAAGFDHFKRMVLPDDPVIIARKIESVFAKVDVVMITGGVSVGKYDYVPEAVRSSGGKIHFHGIAMKPGKPQLYATLPGNRHIFGLPGNPLSGLVGFYEFVLPAMRILSGYGEEQCRPGWRLPLAATVKPRGPRLEYKLAKLTDNGNGFSLKMIPCEGSSDLVAGSHADGMAIIPRDGRKCRAGALVEFRPWRTFL